MPEKVPYELVIFDWEGTLKLSGGLNTALVPGAMGVLNALKAQMISIAIATGASTRNLLHDLAMLELTKYFDAWRTAEQTWSKPNPLMIEEIMAMVGIEKNKTLMVGDSPCDMEMATACGCDCLGVDFQRCSKASLVDAGAKQVINDYTDFFTTVNLI